ncbi:tissue inhibitor of metalloproteinase [Trichonephila clavata]|uniref:Tissue inhibitor of metalloproteinase n=1 Tax=Trichonephila clavata TaxID=2740835 RepID=A0A8X6KWI3_TRICU|nr:tissue inhibitor of metalloproteinase [Trichonephila clavata]
MDCDISSEEMLLINHQFGNILRSIFDFQIEVKKRRFDSNSSLIACNLHLCQKKDKKSKKNFLIEFCKDGCINGHYCVADFVAVVRVKSQGKGDSGITAYHIKVKKEFKMTEKARHALSQGLIWTSSHEAACGVTLHPTRYLIAGRIRGEKPFVSLCHFVQEWPKLSSKQKKGFRKLYQQGCRCRVRMPSFVKNHREPFCSWETFRGKTDCQGLYSLCVPTAHAHAHASNGTEECSWVSTAQYRRCMKERKYEREIEP